MSDSSLEIFKNFTEKEPISVADFHRMIRHGILAAGMERKEKEVIEICQTCPKYMVPKLIILLYATKYSMGNTTCIIGVEKEIVDAIKDTAKVINNLKELS